MKIAIPSQGDTLEAKFEERFGRASKFIIYDLEKKSFNVVNNEQNLNAMQGAGIQAAQNIIKAKADVLLTAHCGPKAFQVLNQAGIKVYTLKASTIQDALKSFENKQVEPLTQANVEGHWA